MSTIPSIDQDTIEQFVGRRNTRRGWDYFRSEAIIDPYRQGTRLRAACIGSGRNPYQVHVVLGEQGIVEARCTCPVGENGQCKHVAALLICWQQTPEVFAEFEAMEKALARCTRRQLVEIIEELLRHRPELRHTIEPLLAKDEVGSPIDGDLVRRQVDELLGEAENTPEGVSRLVESLGKTQQTADSLLGRHESEAASGIYEAILDGLLDHVQFLDVRNVELMDLVYESTRSLAGCLGHLPESGPARLAALRTLVALYRADVVFGEVLQGIDVGRVIGRHAAAGERQPLSDWILAVVPMVESPASRRALGGLLLELAGEELDEAQRFDLCRQTGRIFELVRRLVQSGRFDEVAEESRRADDAELVKIADLLARRHCEEMACRLVEDRATRSGRPILQEWLDRFRARRADRQASLDWSEKLFRLQPTWAAYRQIRGLARQLGRWDQLHGELLAFLEHAGQLALLVRIHLEENDIDQALEVAQSSPAAEQIGVATRVAKAAGRSRPLEALQLYRQVAERLIARRGRDNYAEACRHLRRVRTLMKRTGQQPGWKSYLERLRGGHRPLRALNDELDAAGLGE